MHLLGRRPGGGGIQTEWCCGADPSHCVAGAASPAVFAGAVAPVDLAGTDVPAVAEKEFSAVAEDYSLADDAEGSPWVIRVSKQLRAVVDNIVTVPNYTRGAFHTMKLLSTT